MKTTVENPSGSVEKLYSKESIEGGDTALRGSVKAPKGFSEGKPSAGKPRGPSPRGFAAEGFPAARRPCLVSDPVKYNSSALPRSEVWSGKFVIDAVSPGS